MANFNRPFGSNKVRRTDDNDTPQQKKFEAATGKDADAAVGDVDRKEVPKRTDPSVSGVQAPSGTNKEVWAEAEASALGLNGGFAGASPEGRKIQIQEQYDKMVEEDKKTKEWAGGSGILGDIGEDKPKEK